MSKLKSYDLRSYSLIQAITNGVVEFGMATMHFHEMMADCIPRPETLGDAERILKTPRPNRAECIEHQVMEYLRAEFNAAEESFTGDPEQMRAVFRRLAVRIGVRL